MPLVVQTIHPLLLPLGGGGLGLLALLVIGCWATSIILLMQWHVSFKNPLVYLFILVQMHLYTGLFITAHDAMHGTISSNRTINNLIGYTCTFFYASFWYPKLYTKHHLHHQPCTYQMMIRIIMRAVSSLVC